jgi:carbonic anhydrase
MAAHTCQAIVIHCIDFRLQKPLNDWLERRFALSDYDRVSLAGGVFDFYTILKQVEISDRLHKIKKVILINHEDCGAYGDEDTPERHAHDLHEAERKIEALFPHLDVETYYMHLTGILEDLSQTNR